MQPTFLAKTINLGLILTSALFASAQVQPAQGPTSPAAPAVPAPQAGPVWSPARSIDMFAFPKKTSAIR